MHGVIGGGSGPHRRPPWCIAFQSMLATGFFRYKLEAPIPTSHHGMHSGALGVAVFVDCVQRWHTMATSPSKIKLFCAGRSGELGGC